MNSPIYREAFERGVSDAELHPNECAPLTLPDGDYSLEEFAQMLRDQRDGYRAGLEAGRQG